MAITKRRLREIVVEELNNFEEGYTAPKDYDNSEELNAIIAMADLLDKHGLTKHLAPEVHEMIYEARKALKYAQGVR